MFFPTPRSCVLALSLLVTLGLALAGCDGSDSGSSDDMEIAPFTTVNPETAGAISGKITLDGDAPEADTIQMQADPRCAEIHGDNSVMTEFVITDMEGGLRNVFVYIKGGLEGKRFPVSAEPVTLNQEGCIYVPHVFGIQVGQELQITNSDQTLHNIHATPTANQEFNIGQPVPMSTTRTFDTAEVMVPFKCDVHRWMNSYAGVLDHPYFAVSSADGSYSIGNVPPGDYTVGIWHERLGEMEMAVTVAESGMADASFTYTAAE